MVIDARAAVRPRISGVERWAREMSSRLPSLRPDAYAVAAPPPALSHRAGHGWEQLVLPVVAARLRASLIFGPANLAPVVWPRNVLLLHDVAPFRHPEWYSSAYGAWHRRAAGILVRRAMGIVTVSEFSRAEIESVLGVGSESISVVPGGVDPRFSPRVDPEPVRRRHGLSRPYVLTISGAQARKNPAALDLAGRDLSRLGMDLVSAGERGGHLTAREGGHAVRMLGYVEDQDLPGLYAGATAFVLASPYEGFGLPCLEAMASGVPVAAADRGALPETCSDAAVLFDPDDPQSASQALLSAVSDEQLRQRLREAGLARAAVFTWDACARAMDRLLAGLAAIEAGERR